MQQELGRKGKKRAAGVGVLVAVGNEGRSAAEASCGQRRGRGGGWVGDSTDPASDVAEAPDGPGDCERAGTAAPPGGEGAARALKEEAAAPEGTWLSGAVWEPQGSRHTLGARAAAMGRAGPRPGWLGPKRRGQATRPGERERRRMEGGMEEGRNCQPPHPAARQPQVGAAD